MRPSPLLSGGVSPARSTLAPPSSDVPSNSWNGTSKPTATFHDTESVGFVRVPSICESAARLTPLLLAKSSSDRPRAFRKRLRPSATRRATSAAPSSSPDPEATRGRARGSGSTFLRAFAAAMDRPCSRIGPPAARSLRFFARQPRLRRLTLPRAPIRNNIYRVGRLMVTRKTVYALRALSQLANADQSQPLLASEIAAN